MTICVDNYVNALVAINIISNENYDRGACYVIGIYCSLTTPSELNIIKI
jgi:hypothetical protein